MLSESMQDYLKTIYDLRQQSGRATTNALAEKLGVKAGSVTGMIQRLAEMKLVAYEPYQGAALTQAGEKMALAIIRHHRLVELYLTEAMGYTWDRVHEEADRLEHAISDEFADKISSLLGDPKVDPHGDPIPSKDGTMAAFSTDTLDRVPTGSTVRIERVRDEDSCVLRKVAQLGLMPGTVIQVDREDAQMVVVFGDGLRTPVDHAVAQHIFVTAV